jgi:hypothetical protein
MSSQAPHSPRRDALAAAHAPSGSAAFAEALGGPLGMVESALPPTAFVAAYTLSGQETQPAVIVAVVIGIVLAIARLARRQTVQFALSGLFGIAIAAFVVARTGRAEDFFLPGLLLSVAYAAGLLISIAVRWPIAGVALGLVAQRGAGWRRDPVRMRLYNRITFIFALLFLLRLAVQLPLYFAGAVVVLGTAKVVMGLPLFAVAVWVSWLMLRRAEAAERAAAHETAAEAPSPGADGPPSSPSAAATLDP